MIGKDTKSLQEAVELMEKQMPKGIYNVNEYGLELIKSFERLILTSYDDGYGYLTIGYGHTSDKYFEVKPNQTITPEKAEELFYYDLEVDAITLLNRELLYEQELNDNQYSALVSLVYNSGSLKIRQNGKWIPSQLMCELNSKNFDKAGQLIKYHDVYSAGKPSLGLRRRRLCEYWLYTEYKVNQLTPKEWAKWARKESYKLT